MDINELRDHMRRKSNSPLSKKVWTREIGEDVKLTAEVSPCCWTHRGYGLQLTVTMIGGGDAYVREAGLSFDQATEADCLRLLESVKVVRCSCGKPAFDPALTNRAGKCEACFMAEINAKLERDQKREVARIARMDKKYKSEGKTHRIDAWIHPENGSDFQVCFWMTNPDKKDIVRELQLEGSVVLDDYTITKL